jgi:hypothetical protein
VHRRRGHGDDRRNHCQDERVCHDRRIPPACGAAAMRDRHDHAKPSPYHGVTDIDTNINTNININVDIYIYIDTNIDTNININVDIYIYIDTNIDTNINIDIYIGGDCRACGAKQQRIIGVHRGPRSG